MEQKETLYLAIPLLIIWVLGIIYGKTINGYTEFLTSIIAIGVGSSGLAFIIFAKILRGADDRAIAMGLTLGVWTSVIGFAVALYISQGTMLWYKVTVALSVLFVVPASYIYAVIRR